MHKHKFLAATAAFLTLACSASYAVADPSIDIGDDSSLVPNGGPCQLIFEANATRYIINGTASTAPVGISYPMTSKVIASANACFCKCTDKDGKTKTTTTTSVETTETATHSETSGWSWGVGVEGGGASGQIGGNYDVSDGQDLSVTVPGFTLTATCRSKVEKSLVINKQRQRTSMNAFIAHCYVFPGSIGETWNTTSVYGQTQTTTIHYDKWQFTPTLLNSVAKPCAAGDMSP